MPEVLQLLQVGVGRISRHDRLSEGQLRSAPSDGVRIHDAVGATRRHRRSMPPHPIGMEVQGDPTGLKEPDGRSAESASTGADRFCPTLLRAAALRSGTPSDYLDRSDRSHETTLHHRGSSEAHLIGVAGRGILTRRIRSAGRSE